MEKRSEYEDWLAHIGQYQELYEALNAIRPRSELIARLRSLFKSWVYDSGADPARLKMAVLVGPTSDLYSDFAARPKRRFDLYLLTDLLALSEAAVADNRGVVARLTGPVFAVLWDDYKRGKYVPMKQVAEEGKVLFFDLDTDYLCDVWRNDDGHFDLDRPTGKQWPVT